jgi:hypothetical protein
MLFLRSRFILSWFGVFLFCFGIFRTYNRLFYPLNKFDEGFVLTNAFLLKSGLYPIRDFYSNYPPGSYYLVELAWKLFGVAAIDLRILSYGMVIGIAILSGAWVAKINRGTYSFFSAGFVLMWLTCLPGSSLPYYSALFLTLIFGYRFLSITEAYLLPTPISKVNVLITGIIFGSISFFRHDLFLYLGVLLAFSLVLFIFKARENGFVFLKRYFFAFFAGTALALFIFWGYILLHSSMSEVIRDLYTEQKAVLLARSLPYPNLLAWAPWKRGISLPVILDRPFESGFFLISFIVPLFSFYRIQAAKKDLVTCMPLIIVFLIWLATLPQMCGRTDSGHVMNVITPSLIILSAFIANFWQADKKLIFCASLVLLILVITPLVTSFHWKEIKPQAIVGNSLPHLFPLPDEDWVDRSQVLKMIEERSGPKDPIYVGLWDHRKFLINEVDWYFFSERLGATRFLQFDPNLVNRADIQTEMIDSLEKSRPKVVVLANVPVWDEPNFSQVVGSDLLDHYFEAHYRLLETIGRYKVLIPQH